MFLISEDYWQIKVTKEKGSGVFCKKEIKAGTVIGDYTGTVIRISEYDLDKDKLGLYLMYLTDEASIYPNLDKPDIHLFNHSCVPNCWIYIYHGHTLFFALRTIKPNEELTISYLLSPKDESCNPCTHDCKCGSAVCTGTMHLPQNKYDLWHKFLNTQKKTEVIKFIFNEELPKLKTYPKEIAIDPIYKKMMTT